MKSNNYTAMIGDVKVYLKHFSGGMVSVMIETSTGLAELCCDRNVEEAMKNAKVLIEKHDIKPA